jgi:hypothetical protein
MNQEEIFQNYKHPDLIHLVSRTNMELDIFVAPVALAFEYQGRSLTSILLSYLQIPGIHHYNTHHIFGEPAKQQQRDLEKKMECEKVGITLIPIPFWWQHDKESLAATIRQYRPDLLHNWQSIGSPIPLSNPQTT